MRRHIGARIESDGNDVSVDGRIEERRRRRHDNILEISKSVPGTAISQADAIALHPTAALRRGEGE